MDRDGQTSALRKVPGGETRPLAQGQPASGARGMNANFLLNFKPQPRTRSGWGNSQRWRRSAHKFSREAYMQANFRFAICNMSQQQEHISTQPDFMIDWDLVVEVDLLHSESSLACPITLEPFVCPHMTTCGHIFSLPAIVRHAAVHGGPEFRSAAPCPLCFAPYVVRELRRVRFLLVDEVHIGQSAKLMLLQRKKDWMVPSPAGRARGDGLQESCMERFAKFRVVEAPVGCIADVARDLASYATSVATDTGLEAAEELSMCQHSMNILKANAQNLLDRAKNDGTIRHEEQSSSDFVQTLAETLMSMCIAVREKGGNSSWLSDGASSDPLRLANDAETLASCSREQLPAPGSKHGGPQSNAEDYFFYQLMDGQLAFLHPLNIRCLLSHYGSYSNFPAIVEGKVVEIELAVQSEETRRKLKYLQHLPLSSSFKFLEIDMSATLPQAALEPFMSEISARAKKRKQQAKALARQASKEAKATAKEQAAMLGPSLQEWEMQPRPSDLFYEPGNLDPTLAPFDIGVEEPASSKPAGSESSFAAITRLGFAAAAHSPTPCGLDVPSPESPSPVMGCWGKHTAAPSANNSENMAPGFRWGSATTLLDRNTHVQTDSTSQRKKGKSKVLLYSSGGRRQY